MNEEYHLDELKIALDPAHPSHILPSSSYRIGPTLDVGCGAGQTLIAAYSAQPAFGVDIDIDALKLGKSLSSAVHFVCAKAEALPYRENSFSVVISRVALAYTEFGASLVEIARVLKPGGKLWMTLHGFAVPWRLAKAANLKGKLFFGYVLLNSALLHLSGRQFRFLGRCESFQSEAGITRLLQRSGFEDVSIARGAHFLVTASLAPPVRPERVISAVL